MRAARVRRLRCEACDNRTAPRQSICHTEHLVELPKHRLLRLVNCCEAGDESGRGCVKLPLAGSQTSVGSAADWIALQGRSQRLTRLDCETHRYSSCHSASPAAFGRTAFDMIELAKTNCGEQVNPLGRRSFLGFMAMALFSAGLLAGCSGSILPRKYMRPPSHIVGTGRMGGRGPGPGGGRGGYAKVGLLTGK